MPHFQLFHRSLETKFLLQLSRRMTKGNLPHLTMPRANIRLVTSLLFQPVMTILPVLKSSSGSAKIHVTDAALSLFVPILPHYYLPA